VRTRSRGEGIIQRIPNSLGSCIIDNLSKNRFRHGSHKGAEDEIILTNPLRVSWVWTFRNNISFRVSNKDDFRWFWNATIYITKEILSSEIRYKMCFPEKEVVMVEFDNSNRRHRDDRRVGWSCKRI